MAVSTEAGVWLPTDVSVLTASPGLSVREVTSTTLQHLAFALHSLHHPLPVTTATLKWFSDLCDFMLNGGCSCD